MSPEEKKAFQQMLRGLKNFVGADGKVDLRESDAMLGLVKPFADQDSDCAALVALLEDVRADGKVTEEESRRVLACINAMSSRNLGLVYGIEDRPPVFEALFAALQHLLAIFVAIITPPLLIANGLKIPSEGVGLQTRGFLISMALVASGICTFVQCRRIGPVGSKLLCVQGTSFQFIGPLIGVGFVGQQMATAQGSTAEAAVWGLPMIFGCCIAAAPAEMAAAFLFKRMRKIITPLVSGIVVTLIGLSLVRAGIVSCCGGYYVLEHLPDQFASWQNLTIAASVLLTIVFFNCFRNRFVRMSSVVFGIGLGYVLAAVFGLLHFKPELGVSLPVPFKWGMQFDLGSIIGLAVVYFITSLEAAGDITANSMISGLPINDASYHARVRGGVLADGVNSALAGVFNSFPNSIFAQNNGLIQLTGVASRYVGYFIAAMLLLLGLFPVVGMLFSTMPDPVLGGATLLMFGMVAAAGVRIIASQSIGRKETLVLALAFGAGLGIELCPVKALADGSTVPYVLYHMPQLVRSIFSSGLVTGGVVAILANAFIRIKE